MYVENTCGIDHADVKVLKNYLVVGYGKGRGYHDSVEHPVVYVSAKMLHQQSVEESDAGLQDHKDNPYRRPENTPATFAIRSKKTQNETYQAHSHKKTLAVFSRISNSVKHKIG